MRVTGAETSSRDTLKLSIICPLYLSHNPGVVWRSSHGSVQVVDVDFGGGRGGHFHVVT